MKAKRLYEMGGDITDQFYPSNNSTGSIITAEDKSNAKQNAANQKNADSASDAKLKKLYGPNAILNRTNRSKV